MKTQCQSDDHVIDNTEIGISCRQAPISIVVSIRCSIIIVGSSNITIWIRYDFVRMENQTRIRYEFPNRIILKNVTVKSDLFSIGISNFCCALFTSEFRQPYRIHEPIVGVAAFANKLEYHVVTIISAGLWLRLIRSTDQDLRLLVGSLGCCTGNRVRCYVLGQPAF